VHRKKTADPSKNFPRPQRKAVARPYIYLTNKNNDNNDIQDSIMNIKTPVFVAITAAFALSAASAHAVEPPKKGQHKGDIFHKIDTNGDGKISVQEMMNHRASKLKSAMENADRDGDGYLSKEELRMAHEKRDERKDHRKDKRKEKRDERKDAYKEKRKEKHDERKDAYKEKRKEKHDERKDAYKEKRKDKFDERKDAHKEKRKEWKVKKGEKRAGKWDDASTEDK
jgi:hypothetical protein